MISENLLYTSDLHNFQMINNYIYLYHVDKFIILPEYADDISDNSQASFPSSTPLSRSAPIYSYANSGPRTVTVKFTFHREMMKQINYNNSSFITDDYVDELIKQIQACVLPTYSISAKMVNPPIVALRMGEDIFIKGVINGSLGLTYNLPILENGKYAIVNFSLTISEIDPYDAQTVMKTGSYRLTSIGNLNATLEKNPLSPYSGITNAITAGANNAVNSATLHGGGGFSFASNGHWGGSTTHTSSSGVTHGGGGFSF